jgi:hypothetical protein
MEGAEAEAAAGTADANPHFTRSNCMGWRVPRWIGNGFAASGSLRQRMSPRPVRVIITGFGRAFVVSIHPLYDELAYIRALSDAPGGVQRTSLDSCARHFWR